MFWVRSQTFTFFLNIWLSFRHAFKKVFWGVKSNLDKQNYLSTASQAELDKKYFFSKASLIKLARQAKNNQQANLHVQI